MERYAELESTEKMLTTLQKGVAKGKDTRAELEKAKVIALLEIGRQLTIANMIYLEDLDRDED